MIDTSAQLARGLRRHRAGQLARAEREYRGVLAADPENAEALHLLGTLAESQGNAELAGALLAKAIAVGGPLPEYCAALGHILRSQGRASQAAICYRQAADSLARRLSEHPRNPEQWRLLASVFQGLDSPAEALAALRQAVALRPDWPEAQHDLAMAQAGAGHLDQAEQSYRRALRARPDFPEALNNLGNVLRRLGRPAEAVPRYRTALRKRPGYAEAQYNLGLALQSMDRLGEAERCYRDVLRQRPSLAAAHNNLANTLQAAGDARQALPHYHEAVRLEPANAEFRVNLGIAQLLLGDLPNGFRNYQARTCVPSPGFSLWDGSALAGRPILLRAEQGFGDSIQFIRYASLVKLRGGSVMFACPPPLARILRSVPGIEALVGEGELPAGCGLWAPLMHLPGLLRTTLDNIPAVLPYLSSERDLARDWADTLRLSSSHLKIGIAWRGSPQHRNDRNRSIEPGELAVLSGLPKVTFVSLQPGYEYGCETSRLSFAPLRRPLLDFADTSALIENLDLVITVDTAVAHLAGALARPVWTLLPFAPDWRWMLGRDDSPWYPGMRLFRQRQRGDWRAVLLEVRAAIESMLR